MHSILQSLFFEYSHIHSGWMFPDRTRNLASLAAIHWGGIPAMKRSVRCVPGDLHRSNWWNALLRTDTLAFPPKSCLSESSVPETPVAPTVTSHFLKWVNLCGCNIEETNHKRYWFANKQTLELNCRSIWFRVCSSVWFLVPIVSPRLIPWRLATSLWKRFKAIRSVLCPQPPISNWATVTM